VSPLDEQEYGDFVAARSRRLCEFAYLLCGDWHQAEDAVQHALTRLYLAWGRLHNREAVDPYVRRIVLRAVLDSRRLARVRRESSWASPPETPDRSGAVEATADRLAVLAALAKVAPRQRAVLVLRYWEDQSVEDVAVALGCSIGTVKSQAARGLQTLRALLTEDVTA
jgi:RNA polymerase sigma-70 factor (sigma-E family)